jgi:hypothetical protein
LAFNPLGGFLMAAFGAGPVIAGMVAILELSAIALVKFSAQTPGATGNNGLHRRSMGRQNLAPMKALVLWPVMAKGFGDVDHGKEACRDLRAKSLIQGV